MAKHKDLEFAVDGYDGAERIFKTFDEAAGFAVAKAVSQGEKVNLDVLTFSAAGAKAWGGDDAADQYREDPDASVFERVVISANPQGSVP